MGIKHGITFKGEVGKTVDFLDITVSLTSDGKLRTKMFVKPTDATRYLNRRSDHSPHTFVSIPFSQFCRAVVLCSDPTDKVTCMDYIAEKLGNSGFKDEEINMSRLKAMKIDRDKLLSKSRNQEKEADAGKKLMFLINRDGFMCKEIKRIVKEYQMSLLCQR